MPAASIVDFALSRPARFAPSIAICTEGVVTLVGAQSATLLRQGESCFITPDEGDVTVEADSTTGLTSTVFIATGTSE